MNRVSAYIYFNSYFPPCVIGIETTNISHPGTNICRSYVPLRGSNHLMRLRHTPTTHSHTSRPQKKVFCIFLYVKSIYLCLQAYSPTGFEKYAYTCPVADYRVNFSVWDTSGKLTYLRVHTLLPTCFTAYGSSSAYYAVGRAFDSHPE